MVTINDPLFAQQWHFKLLGNIQKIWTEYTGRGVHVGVYDDGLQYTHPDLNGNYDSTLRFRNNGVTFDPYPISLLEDDHGTSVSGIIAAEANNGIGGVGVAYNAKLTGVSILSDSRFDSEAVSLLAFRHAAAFDVMSNSWGFTPLFEDFQNASESYSNAWSIIDAFDEATVVGRNGLGTVIVQAAGNDSSNASADGLNTAKQVISVAALYEDGSVADYSNYGCNILVSAGAASVTTDLMGASGYDTSAGPTGDYTSEFGGTSAATPVVSGVVALMLDANGGLGWRDVKEILANSAKMTGSITGGSGEFEAAATKFQVIDRQAASQLVRSSDSWNDGGRAISWSYGFGRIDAFAAVRLAEVWTQIHGPAQTSANELSYSLYNWDSESLTYDGSKGEVAASVYFSDHLSIDYVKVTMGLYFTDPNMETSSLNFYLVGPGGATFKLLRGSDLAYDDVSGGFSWSFGVSQAMGLDAHGTWSLKVIDSAGASANHMGTLGQVQIDFKGSAFTTHNIHHITQDFLLANAKDRVGLRDRVITDTNGGTDWLQMATLSGDVVASLNQGAHFSVGGKTWGKIATGTSLENLVTGDGADKLTGNAQNNIIFAMRGNDTVNGGAGEDKLGGGAGRDLMYGNDGHDTLRGNAGNDSMAGSAGNDYLVGGDGNDYLNGGLGSDRIEGDAGSDTLIGSGSADTFIYRTGSQADLISDFVNDIDTVQIDDLLWGGTARSVANVLADFAHLSGGSVVLNFGGGNVLTIAHLTSISVLLDDIKII